MPPNIAPWINVLYLSPNQFSNTGHDVWRVSSGAQSSKLVQHELSPLSNSSRIEHMDYKNPFCDQFDSGQLIVLTSDIALTSDTGDR